MILKVDVFLTYDLFLGGRVWEDWKILRRM